MAVVRVNLDHARISEDLSKRYILLASIADEMLRSGILDPAEVFLNEDELLRTVQAYYLLNEAYKIDKLGHVESDDEHWTEDSKKAALTTLAIMQFRPIRVQTPQRSIRNVMTSVASQSMALACAGSFMGRDYAHLTWEMQRRLFTLLDYVGRKPGFRLNSLRQYIRDQRQGRYLRSYDIDLNQDMPLIDSMIVLFDSPLRP